LQDKAPDAPPSIYLALRESLGLELKSGRGPAEVIVIDHIERQPGTDGFDQPDAFRADHATRTERR
jgi:uncharacterized protein (TIGR03435 family)